MQTIEERAKDYASQVHCFRPDLCALDYIAGAKEERILMTEKMSAWVINVAREHNLPNIIERFKQDFYGNESL